MTHMSQTSFDLSRSQEHLTVLSFGGGQDSSALAEMYLRDIDGFRAKYAPGRLIAVMSDTGDEFPLTYKHVREVQSRFEAQGIPFFFLTKDLGYHTQAWPSLIEYYRSKNTVGSKCFPKTCTDNLKIRPIYKFLDAWVAETYGYPTAKGKLALKSFAREHGKINVMIGIAAGEEKRVRKNGATPGKWYDESIQTIYPLLDLGMDRAACQELLHSLQMHVIPSNCMRCPFMDVVEIEYMRRFHPEELEEWVEIEAAKLANNRHMEAVEVTDKKTGKKSTVNKNYGVFKDRYLPEIIEVAKEKYSNWSDERVAEHRYSHGHCVASAY